MGTLPGLEAMYSLDMGLWHVRESHTMLGGTAVCRLHAMDDGLQAMDDAMQCAASKLWMMPCAHCCCAACSHDMGREVMPGVLRAARLCQVAPGLAPTLTLTP